MQFLLLLLICQWGQKLDARLMFALFDMLHPSGLSRCCTAVEGIFGHQCFRSLSGLPSPVISSTEFCIVSIPALAD